MDPGEGTSDSNRINRKRKQMFTILEDSDIEEELFADHSEDDYQPSEEESASESEGEVQLYNIELRPPGHRTSSPIAQDQDLQGNSPFVTSSLDNQSQVQAYQPSIAGSTSVLTTTGDLNKFDFTKSNEFYGEVMGVEPIDYFNYFFNDDLFTLICSETNAQAQRLLDAHKRPRNEEEPNREIYQTQPEVSTPLIYNPEQLSAPANTNIIGPSTSFLLPPTSPPQNDPQTTRCHHKLISHQQHNMPTLIPLRAETALSGRLRGFIRKCYVAGTCADVRHEEARPALTQLGPPPCDGTCRGGTRGVRQRAEDSFNASGSSSGGTHFISDSEDDDIILTEDFQPLHRIPRSGDFVIILIESEIKKKKCYYVAKILEEFRRRF
ncbi:unnamed protein product [Arctia plantaginis]|uniref:Uncharacterized protein n=1 Tax=Arctia plantaginis TaxID=874455 RepID=A0A8S0Z3I6_ARCPL|nr:unnamed protein product [Arctia plantaginis]